MNDNVKPDTVDDPVYKALVARLAHLDGKIKQLRGDMRRYFQLAQKRKTDMEMEFDHSMWTGDDQPVSFRNCNPGNLRPTANNLRRWKGEIDTPNGYACFKDMTHGTRAMLYLLKLSYGRRHRLHTIKEIVDRYAPLGDNSTASHAGYIDYLRKRTACLPDPCNFEDKQTLFIFAQAITEFESGRKITPLSGLQGKALFDAAYVLLPK